MSDDERIRSSEACICCCLTNFQEPKLMFFQAQVLSYAILFLWNHSSQDVHLQGVTFFKLIWWRSCDLYNLLTSVVHHQHLGILMQRGRYSLRISNPLDGRPIRRPNSGAVGGHMDFQQLEKTCWNHFSCFLAVFFAFFFSAFFFVGAIWRWRSGVPGFSLFQEDLRPFFGGSTPLYEHSLK